MNVSIASRVTRSFFFASVVAAAFAVTACSGGADSVSNAPATTPDGGTATNKETNTPKPGTGGNAVGSKDGTKKPPAKNEATNCGGLVACIGSCDEDDEKCSDECVEEASPEAIEQIQELVACINASECADAECARAACAAEFQGCDGLD